MQPDRDDRQVGPEDRLREIPKWARRFAQNQTVPVMVSQVIFALGAGAFGGLGCLTAWAYLHDRRALAAAGIVALCAFAAWWLWFSFVGGGGVIRRISGRLSRRTGTASIGSPACAAGQQMPGATGFAFIFCVFASVGLGLMGFIPERYMQPVSAIYVVPFMLYLAHKQRHTSSPFMMLWPALYAVHAVLIMVGAPISRGPLFDMLVPTVGYGFVAALAGYVYSRVALRRLRSLASSRPEPPAAGGETDVRA